MTAYALRVRPFIPTNDLGNPTKAGYAILLARGGFAPRQLSWRQYYTLCHAPAAPAVLRHE